MSNKDQIIIIGTERLRRSPSNPRKTFNETKLGELADSIREHGVITPLLVRPFWCVGLKISGDFAAVADGAKVIDPYEIVAGERRFRASLLAEKVDVPCIVRELSDTQALELQLIENLQRTDLEPLEEAEGFSSMLELRGDDGKPLYTVKTIAARLGQETMYVYRRLKLLALPPSAIQAMAGGQISPSVGSLIGRLPDEKLREKLTGEILNDFGAVMNVKEAEDHIARNYIRSTANAPFDVKDGGLLPDMGPCTTCPNLAKNMPEAEGVRADNCMNPACFERKVAAQYARFSDEHKKEGMRPLTAKENEKAVQGESFRPFACSIVPVDGHPDAHQLKPGVQIQSKQSWRELTKGRGVEIVVGRSASGKPLYGVVLEKAVAAAKLNGHDIFATRETASQTEFAEQQRQKAELQKKNLKFAKELLPRIAKAVAGDSGEWLDWLSRLLVSMVGEHMVSDRFLKFADLSRKELMELAESNKGKELCAFAAQVLFVKNLAHDHAIEKPAYALLKDIGVDVRAVRNELAAAEKSGSKSKVAAVKKDEKSADASRSKKPGPATKKPAGKSVKAASAAKSQAKEKPSGFVKLSQRIVAELKSAGDAGLDVKALAGRLNVKPQILHVWFATTGKKTKSIRSLGKSQYRFEK